MNELENKTDRLIKCHFFMTFLHELEGDVLSILMKLKEIRHLPSI
jgi:hypothetical protein